MKGSHSPVELESVDFSERTFAIRRFSPSDALHRSLDRHGILNPPWVLSERAGRFIIVDGFKRLEWARDRRLQSIDCMVFPADSDRAALMLNRIEARLFGPSPNAAEKAQIVSKLARHVPSERLPRELAGMQGLVSHPGAVEAWRRVADSGGALLPALGAEEIGERAALEIVKWDEADRDAMIALLKILRCSSSIQLEIVERVDEISRQQGRSRREVLHEGELTRIAADPGANRRQKTQEIREVLRHWRFPRLSARADRFAEELVDASLPGGIEVVPPPSFEGEDWQLRIGFSDPEQLRIRLEAAERFARSPNLARLMRHDVPGCRK